MNFKFQISNQFPKTILTTSIYRFKPSWKRLVLDNRNATTNWRSFDFLRELASKAHISKDVRFDLEEYIFTSAGVPAGIDLSLYFVMPLLGIELEHSTPRYMDYPYPKNDF